MAGSVLEVPMGEGLLKFGPGGLVVDEIVGDMDAQSARERLDRTIAWCDEVGESIRLVVDLSRTGKVSWAARKLFWAELPDLDLYRLALYAPHPLSRMIARFVISTMGMGTMRVFGEMAEAFEWVTSGGDDGG